MARGEAVRLVLGRLRPWRHDADASACDEFLAGLRSASNGTIDIAVTEVRARRSFIEILEEFSRGESSEYDGWYDLSVSTYPDYGLLYPTPER
jgi:hypothetical protein